jgi:DNA-binding XRE family transcriptional regulator
MMDETAGNLLRSFRRKHKLSQRELGVLIGYPCSDSVGRHERSEVAPPLLIALAYEIVFGVPVGQLFTGFHGVVAQAVARNAEDLRRAMEQEHGHHEFEFQWLTAIKQRIENPTNFTRKRDS